MESQSQLTNQAPKGLFSGMPALGRLLLAGACVPGVLALPAQASPTPSKALPAAVSAAAQNSAKTPDRYVLAGATGARLMNLADSKGREVLQVKGDTPLAVYPSRAGSTYLKVAVPGGVKIWVYGKYLVESSRPGWVEVAGSYVNMRPLPRSQDSFPLGQLDRGDRLRLIKRQDPSKPMTEDWVQVYSPPDTMAYVLAAETRALPAGADAKALWATAVTAALNGQATTIIPAGAGAAKPAGNGISGQAPAAGATASGRSVFNELAAADRAMDQALAGSATPDYAALLASYQAILALGPDAPTRSLIAQRIDRLEAHHELAQIRAEIEQGNKLRDEQLEQLRGEAERGRLSNDPLWGRFQTRGWLERQTRDGKRVYLVRWGAGFTAQVQCSSGRYDLDLYNGFEIGIKGVPVRSAQVTSGGYPLIDIDRIEVISARRPAR